MFLLAKTSNYKCRYVIELSKALIHHVVDARSEIISNVKDAINFIDYVLETRALPKICLLIDFTQFHVCSFAVLHKRGGNCVFNMLPLSSK